MGYRLDWRLLGRDNRLLDSGEIDNGFRDRRSALETLAAFLHQFALWGRDSERNSWWAKRSEDADLRILITLREQVPFEAEIIPAPWVAQQRGQKWRPGRER